jgi:hypothetical protein
MNTIIVNIEKKILETLYEVVIDNTIVLEISVFEEKLHIIFDIMDRVKNMNKLFFEDNIYKYYNYT